MKPEHVRRLETDFPFMRRTKELADRGNPYHMFGFECQDGWYQLIYDLCSEINDVLASSAPAPEIEITQVKEKYDGLRFYYVILGQPRPIPALDMIDGPSLRMYPKGDSTSKKVAEIVQRYEKKSETICEFCGKSRRLRNDLPWISTLGDEHYEQRVRKDKS